MIKFDLSVRYDNDLSRIYFADFIAQNDVLLLGKRIPADKNFSFDELYALAVQYV